MISFEAQGKKKIEEIIDKYTLLRNRRFTREYF